MEADVRNLQSFKAQFYELVEEQCYCQSKKTVSRWQPALATHRALQEASAARHANSYQSNTLR